MRAQAFLRRNDGGSEQVAPGYSANLGSVQALHQQVHAGAFLRQNSGRFGALLEEPSLVPF